ncbi:ABC transporter ATP-binding protein [Haloarchaeobius sp. TZWWS8]|uniref:ABC transporter ATP-binding protein n=1 Tax=Haloarchaeobius sp. TZWWS8 TaxID=3446121 RepID=UPI003EB72E10
MTKNVLEVDDLSKSFSGVQAVAGASFHIEEGELVGLIGPNGAGKTTTFDLVSGVLDADSGTVSLRGDDVTDLAPHELARRGMVRTFQQSRELTSMTVRENIALGDPGHPGERAATAVFRPGQVQAYESDVHERVDELLEMFELSRLADEYAASLSGGQRKLLEVARALILDPDLMLLDEPFAGVNPTLQASIAEHIVRLNREEGRSFLIVEHEIETLADMVERIIVLDQGSVLTTGTPEEVLSDERVIDAYLGGDQE